MWRDAEFVDDVRAGKGATARPRASGHADKHQEEQSRQGGESHEEETESARKRCWSELIEHEEQKASAQKEKLLHLKRQMRFGAECPRPEVPEEPRAATPSSSQMHDGPKAKKAPRRGVAPRVQSTGKTPALSPRQSATTAATTFEMRRESEVPEEPRAATSSSRQMQDCLSTDGPKAKKAPRCRVAPHVQSTGKTPALLPRQSVMAAATTFEMRPSGERQSASGGQVIGRCSCWPLCTTRLSKVATKASMTTGIGHNAAYTEPGGEPDGDNYYWEEAGLTLLAEASRTAIAGCNHVVIGRARMWILGQEEVIKAVVTGLSEHAIIVNCKDVRVPGIDQVCQQRAPAITVLDPMNIGYAPDRWWRFEHALQMSIRAVNLGGDVVIHCRSGVHRAALVFALNLMFLKAGTSFKDACQQLQNIRPQVDLHGIINPQVKRNNHLTEDKNPWIREWERWSKKQQYYRQIQNKS